MNRRRAKFGSRLLAPILASALTLPILPASGGAQEPAASASAALKTQMNAQNDPVGRARAFPKYGEALIKEARTAVSASDHEKAESILIEYRDTVKQLHEGLRGRVPDPEKRPNGFKQLQIHVRKAIRDIDDLVASVPANLQPPFDFLRREIERLDRALIDDLFPRREPKKGKS